MLKYFRINDPYRLVVLFVILLGLRLPVMLGDHFLTYPELNYLLIGEKLSAGFRMYEGLWSNTGPFSAMVYGVLEFLFGKSLLSQQILSLFVIFFQCYLFNKILLLSKAYNENTYIPGVTYGILMSWFFDEFSLSPAILGLTFVLVTINGVLRHMEIRANRDEHLLYIGLHLGVAILFYLPYIIFLPFILIAFLLFTGTTSRRYFLFIYGIILPILLAGIYFMITGRLAESLTQYLYPLFNYPVVQYFSWAELGIIFVLPLIFTFLGMIALLQKARLTVFQSDLSRFMMIWLVFGGVYLLMCNTIVPAYLVVFVPPMAFYISHYFMLIKKKWMAELLFILFFIGPVFFNLGTLFTFFPTSHWVEVNKYFVTESPEEELVHGKHILVLDDDKKPYLHASSATPFFDFPLSKSLFEDWQYYDNLTVIAQGFFQDMPDVIIDKNTLMPNIFDHIPLLASYYREENPGIYVRTNSNLTK